MTSKTLVCLAFAALCMTAGARARADEVSDFEKGRAAYAAKNYDDADRRFREMLDSSTGSLHDPTLINEARMYWGASLYSKHLTKEASSVFEKLLIDKPEYEPDPLRFPQEVINFFIDTRRGIIDKINEAKARKAREDKEKRDAEIAWKARQEARLHTLEDMASQETTIEHHSRLFALLPFGAGQFQNGDNVLGWTFLGTESALFIAASVTFPIYRVQISNASDAFSKGQTSESQQWLDRAASTRLANLVLFGAFAVTAIAGVLQAEVAFVPEKIDIKRRPIPSVGTVTPTIAPLVSDAKDGSRSVVSGGFLGVSGSF